MTGHEIEFEPLRIDAGEVAFSWSVAPATSLYQRTSFYLRFPESVDPSIVPDELWWRIGLLCLHPHWVLLRPCRIRLPVCLPAAEQELWLRLTDAAVASLEAQSGGDDTARTIELLGSGPLLGPPRAASGDASRASQTDRSGIVSCFSGGRDSLTQAAMLVELGESPLLVAVTSPVAWSPEHETPRRGEVIAEIGCRRGLELVEVHSDLRGNVENTFAAGRYRVGVNECSDALLYLAAAIAVAAARGARLVAMASESEVQANVRRGGMVVQARHFMYSAATHRAIAAMLGPSGIGVASLTNSLRQFQVQRLLAERYADLRDLQYSCWELSRTETACSRCLECRRIALNLLAQGVAPDEAGIDTVTLLLSLADWEPGGRYLAGGSGNGSSPRELTGRALEMQELRCLATATRAELETLLDGHGSGAARDRALSIYDRLRERALTHDLEPEPGYWDGYLELLDERLREPVRALIAEQFSPAPVSSYERTLANTRTLSDWIIEPLRRRARPASPAAQPLAPPAIPDPEPPLEHPPGGRLLRVAAPELDGNERAYVEACLSENWISSAGQFVTRLEESFAAAVGCRYGIACSSGTAALHLALAASGIGPGDEVLMPAFTMIATASAALYVGAAPVLVDADPDTWNLDPSRLADKLSRRTRAVIPVHVYGQPAAMAEILEFAARNRLVVIEDAAEAHGARYGGRPVGSLGEVAAFSLYANKIVTSGEGGMVTTNDARIAALARELRDHAFSRERHFWHRRLGFNYRMTNLQAAVGLAQVERLDLLIGRRRENARRYREALAGIEGLALAPTLEGGVDWMFGVTIAPEFGVSRDELRRRLAARGVETRTFFVPLHLQPVHRRRFAGQRYPVAEGLCATGLYLPSSSALTEADIGYVASAIRASRAAPGVVAHSPNS